MVLVRCVIDEVGAPYMWQNNAYFTGTTSFRHFVDTFNGKPLSTISIVNRDGPSVVFGLASGFPCQVYDPPRLCLHGAWGTPFPTSTKQMPGPDRVRKHSMEPNSQEEPNVPRDTEVNDRLLQVEKLLRPPGHLHPAHSAKITPTSTTTKTTTSTTTTTTTQQQQTQQQ